MDYNLLNIGGHGLGDCILSLQISYLLNQQHIKHKTLISTRNEVYKPLWYIFGNVLDVEQINENIAHENRIITDKSLQSELKSKYNALNITYNVPDLLFRSPLALDYKQYGLNPQLIKKTRILNGHFAKKEKIIYCGLTTTTKGYTYENIPILLRSLAEHLPDYTIYFPKVKRWDKEINYDNFNISFPKNVFIHDDPTFEESLDWLVKSEYGIFTCNGPSHIAYQLGIPRLILDPQFNRIPWMSRWKEDYEECVPINTNYSDVVKLVDANIKYPQTTLIDRKYLLNLIQNNQTTWKDIFFFKY